MYFFNQTNTMKNTIYLITIFALVTACKPIVNDEQSKEVLAPKDSNALITNQKPQDQGQSVEVSFDYAGKWSYVKDEKEYYKEGTNHDDDKGLIIKSMDKSSDRYQVEMTLSDGAAETWFEGTFNKDSNGQLTGKVKYYEGEGEFPNINLLIKYKDNNSVIVKINSTGTAINNNEIIFERTGN